MRYLPLYCLLFCLALLQSTNAGGHKRRASQIRSSQLQGNQDQGSQLQGAQQPNTQNQGNQLQDSQKQDGQLQGSQSKGSPSEGVQKLDTEQQGKEVQVEQQQGTPQQSTPQQDTPQQGTPQQGIPQQDQGASLQSTQLQGITSDAPFSVNQSAIASTVTCLDGTIQGRSGGVVLLVHGTGGTGNETWVNGPYDQILPKLTPGFDVCFLNLPNRAQTDIQVTSEYVAGNIIPLARKSKTGKISLIGHSQGNLNIQWSLNFWPSTRRYVQHFVSVAGDFHGSDQAPGFCDLWGILNQGNCTQACLQQATTRSKNGKSSMFLTALNHFGNTALVPTTSIYTIMDNVIQNEKGPNATSILPNAENILLQDTKVCNASHNVDHFTIINDPGAFNLAYGALVFAAGATLNDWKPSLCDEYVGKDGFDTFWAKTSNMVPGIISIMADGQSIPKYDHAKTETKLLPYVCASGSAPNDQCQ